MNHDEMIDHDVDARLQRLFAEKNEPLPDHEFAQQLFAQLQRQYRLRMMIRAGAVMLILMLAAVLSPWVMRGTMGMFSLVASAAHFPAVQSLMAILMTLFGGGMFIWSRRRA